MYETQKGGKVNDDCIGCSSHDVGIINETMQKCHKCKKYFKEVDMNGELLNKEYS